MRRRKKTPYDREVERSARRYRNTLAQLRRAERLLTQVIQRDREVTSRFTGTRGTLTDKQYDNVNAARWKLAAAFRRK